jgi:hypothetical protein
MGLAVGHEGVWVLPGDGRVARIDEEARGLEMMGEPEERRHMIAVAHGAVWTFAWTQVPDGSTLSRLDISTGRLEASISLAGSPQALLVDATAVWAYMWRRRDSGTIDGFLVRVAPDTVEVAGEVLLTPTGAYGPILDGVMLAPAADPYAHAERGLPSQLRRIDASTGAVLGAIPVAGWLEGLVLGPSSVWGWLERRGEWPSPVLELAVDGSWSRVVSLDTVDISGHLPPPPPRIDARHTEQEVRERLAEAFFGGWIGKDPETGAEIRRPYIRGVEFEDVRLEGEFPDTEVVALFRSVEHPGVLFGRRQRIWDDDGAFSEVIGVMDVNVMEDIVACGYGLPRDPQPGESGIAWF